ncbi:MAG: enoyl-CoA hydratase-related protein [Thermoanaerobaculia bacterium]|nr:enoyl-CoA hydratase-related protein [Thermoanaerobaculia bacterium]
MTHEVRCLQVEQHGCVLWAVLHRPEVRNALDDAMVRELHGLCQTVEDGSSEGMDEVSRVRVVVLRGAGGTFCAGGDVVEMKKALEGDRSPGDRSEDPLFELSREFGRLLERLDALPCVVVAAVEGAAMGGGLGLACVADLVLSTDDAIFGMPEVRLGLIPAQIAPYVARRAGPAKARTLAVTARLIRGVEALRQGLVDECHPGPEALETALNSCLREILLGAPKAVASVKALMSGIDRRDRSEVLDEGARRFAVAARGTEAREAMAAFADRRPSPWARIKDSREDEA